MPRFFSARNLYFIFLGSYLAMAFASAFNGAMGSDEEVDYLGLRDQLSFAGKVLTGKNPSFVDIHDNLEFYGIAGKLPGWILWFIYGKVNGIGISIDEALNSFHVNHLREGYFFFSHVSLALMATGLSLVVLQSAKKLSIPYPFIVAGISLWIPSLMGQSLINIKDYPFALFYTCYTFSLIERQQKILKSGIATYGLSKAQLISILSGALLISTKAIFIIPFLITELSVAVSAHLCTAKAKKVGACRNASNIRPSGMPEPLLSVIAIIISALILAILFHPAAWLEPVEYLKANVAAFSHNFRSHCGLFMGQCIGPEHPNWSAFAYLLKWLYVKTPIFIVAGFCLLLVSLRRHSLTENIALLPLILQAFLTPFLAVLKNSSLYTQDRHILFVYPALLLLACIGYARILQISSKQVSRAVRCVASISLVFMLIDCLLLNPFQYLYISEFARPFVNGSNTIADYQGFGSAEAVQKALRKGYLPRDNVFVKPINQFPLNSIVAKLGFNQGEQAKLSLSYYSTISNVLPSLPEHPDGQDCSHTIEISRPLLLSQRLRIGRLYVCE